MFLSIKFALITFWIKISIFLCTLYKHSKRHFKNPPIIINQYFMSQNFPHISIKIHRTQQTAPTIPQNCSKLKFMKYSIIYLPTKLDKLNSSSLINVLAGKHISTFHRKFTQHYIHST